jgi:hypothetical protein
MPGSGLKIYKIIGGLATSAPAALSGRRRSAGSFEKLLRLALRHFSGSPFLVAIGGIADISSDARNVEDAPMAEMDRSILLCCKTGLQPGAFCTFRT